jgi:hypothetical protein
MLRHPALLLDWLTDQTQTGGGTQHRLELKQEKESSEQRPHSAEHYSFSLGNSSADG